jgi:ferredoxin-NADP reductase
MFVTRMRDTAFKRSLKRVPPGTEVQMSSAMGSFTLHKNPARPAVFLAGGIGITPFFSIVRQADHDRFQHKLYFFYANHRPEDAPFLDLLKDLDRTNPNFRFIGAMTDMSRSKISWDGETGRIDKEMLSTYLSDLQGSIYYIAGPPAMVAAMRQVLVAANLDEDDIRTEEFAGY